MPFLGMVLKVTLQARLSIVDRMRSCLRYLHLPENLDDVHFDLNMRHPDDEYKMFKEDITDKTVSQKRAPKGEDLLLWIKDVGFEDKRWSYNTSPSNLTLTSLFGLNLLIKFIYKLFIPLQFCLQLC
jgi:hypothetical protein